MKRVPRATFKLSVNDANEPRQVATNESSTAPRQTVGIGDGNLSCIYMGIKYGSVVGCQSSRRLGVRFGFSYSRDRPESLDETIREQVADSSTTGSSALFDVWRGFPEGMACMSPGART